ncbi:MAG: FtsW/RodA/SpoVE family cell cycle protein, partial [Phycisphaerales bacterium]
MRSVTNMLARGGSAWLVVIASLALSVIGVLAIDVAETLDPAKSMGPVASRQVVNVCVGLVACGVIAMPHYRRLGPWSWAAAIVVLLLLLFLLIPFIPSSIVRPRGGARSWIDVGPMDFQPSELAKLVYIVVLAWYLRYRRNHRTMKGLLPPAIITGIPVGLIILQPDLGTALLFVPALFFVLIAAGAKLKHLVLVIAIAMLAAPAAYPLL